MPARATSLHPTWTIINGRRSFARVSTDPTREGRPIVLVHGFGVSGRYLAPTAALLAPKHSVYVPDLPGSGRSDGPSDALAIGELAEFLADWMTALNLPRATLLGNSFGCQIIVEFALRHPGRIERAVLIGPTVDPSTRFPLCLALRLFLDAARERPSEVVIAIRDYARFGVRRGAQTAAYMIDDPIEKDLPRVMTPTLVVRGGEDPIVMPEWAERVANLLPAGRLVVIPGAAHAVNYDAPAALEEQVERFLETD